MELFKLFGTIAVNNDEANQNIDETTGKAEGAESRMSAAFKKIGSAVAAAFAVDKIVAFGKSITEAAATVAAEQSSFEQIMGDYSNTAQEKVNEIANTTGMVATRLTPYMTSMTAKFKGLGYDIEEATSFASDGLELAADAAAFWDKSLDDSMSALNSFINGSYEGGEAIGLFANDTQMASYAVKQGIVSETKEWANLDEARKQATRLEYAQAMFEQSGATGQAAKEADQYANVQANLTEKYRQFKAQIGEPVLQNIVLPAMEKLSGLVDKASEGFEKLKEWISDNKDELKQAAETVSELAEIAVYAAGIFIAFKAAMAIQKAVQGFQTAQVALSMLSLEIGGANLAQAALNGALTVGETIVGLLTGKINLATLAQGLMAKGQAALNAVLKANPIVIIITLLTALVAAFIYLWNNCEGFRNFWIGLWDGIKKVAKAVVDWLKQAWTDIGNFFATTLPEWFNSFKESLSNAWSAIKNFFSGIWNGIKEFFSNLWNGIKESLSNVWSGITEFFSIVWDGIVDFFSIVWDGIKNVLTVALMSIVELIKGYFNLITLPFRFIWENCKETIITVWNAVSEFLIKIFVKIKNLFIKAFNIYKNTIITVFDTVKSFITTVWNGITNTISSIVDRIKNIVSNVFNTVKTTVINIFDSVKTKVTSVWNGIKEAIETPINNAKNTVKNAVDKIKGFFDNLKIKFPNIKLPHFKLTGKFSLSPPSVPKISIDWYKKAMNNAMLLNSPTIFGMNGAGQLMGGGEAGQEVVAGSNTLMSMIRGVVRSETAGISEGFERLISILETYFPEIISSMGNDIVLNDGVLVGRIAPKMDSKLGDISRSRERGK